LSEIVADLVLPPLLRLGIAKIKKYTLYIADINVSTAKGV
jgi:hypothetical protein